MIKLWLKIVQDSCPIHSNAEETSVCIIYTTNWMSWNSFYAIGVHARISQIPNHDNCVSKKGFHVRISACSIQEVLNELLILIAQEDSWKRVIVPWCKERTKSFISHSQKAKPATWTCFTVKVSNNRSNVFLIWQSIEDRMLCSCPPVWAKSNYWKGSNEEEKIPYTHC